MFFLKPFLRPPQKMHRASHQRMRRTMIPTTTVTGMEMRRLLVYLRGGGGALANRDEREKGKQGVPALSYIKSRA